MGIFIKNNGSPDTLFFQWIGPYKVIYLVKKSSNVSPRKPKRIVSKEITSLGAMFPTLTLAPTNLTNQTCWDF
jgi:hypothetical protein